MAAQCSSTEAFRSLALLLGAAQTPKQSSEIAPSQGGFDLLVSQDVEAGKDHKVEAHTEEHQELLEEEVLAKHKDETDVQDQLSNCLHDPPPKGGNPAAVCPLLEDLRDDLKQKIAAEMNLSETAFIFPQQGLDQSGDALSKCPEFKIQWFTPTTEVALCGHATLAAAKIEDHLDQREFSSIPVDTSQMTKIDTQGRVEAIILTCQAPLESGYDFFSRFFCPWLGISEDPVTGSAHSVLGPFWQGVSGKARFKARQCSQRGGEMDVEVGKDRTELIADSYLVLEAGNPTAVCPLLGDLSEDIKQKIGAEMNRSGTGFIIPLGVTQASNECFSTCSLFTIQWYSPTTEVPLCGHGTLAAAKVLMGTYGNDNSSITFKTRTCGDLIVSPRANGKMCLSLPNSPPDVSIPDSDVAMHQLIRACVGNRTYLKAKFSPYANNCLVIQIENCVDQKEFSSILVDTSQLIKIDTQGRVEAVIMTCQAPLDSGYDFFSRYFCPWMGIPEDPVTGSAHSVLGPFWQGILGKSHLKARQCSHRSGEMELIVGEDRTELIADACLIMEGSLNI
eukprot:maker-scaffold71_size417697-snap-gene-2.14 protein:Tk11803 transcript:maker-scaffold71_size417697-snap-gene-2.14-mRNA-1 annotation:"hypothetical protein LOTGIDRAFT_229292"